MPISRGAEQRRPTPASHLFRTIAEVGAAAATVAAIAANADKIFPPRRGVLKTAGLGLVSVGVIGCAAGETNGAVPTPNAQRNQEFTTGLPTTHGEYLTNPYSFPGDNITKRGEPGKVTYYNVASGALSADAQAWTINARNIEVHYRDQQDPNYGNPLNNNATNVSYAQGGQRMTVYTEVGSPEYEFFSRYIGAGTDATYKVTVDRHPTDPNKINPDILFVTSVGNDPGARSYLPELIPASQ